MKVLTDLPPGFVAVPLKGAVLVIPERIYVAGLWLGKTLRRREAMQQRDATSMAGPVVHSTGGSDPAP